MAGARGKRPPHRQAIVVERALDSPLLFFVVGDVPTAVQPRVHRKPSAAVAHWHGPSTLGSLAS